MIIRSASLTDNLDLPVIGYHNIIYATALDATTEDFNFPVTNLANTKTGSKWLEGSGVDANTLLLLNMENNLDDESIYDRIVSSSGALTFSSSTVGSGSYSAESDGTGYISVPDSPDFYIPGGSFTIEFDMLPSAIPDTKNIFGQGSASNSYFRLLLNTDGSLQLQSYIAGTSYVEQTSATGVIAASASGTDPMYRITVMKDGSDWIVAVDDTIVITATQAVGIFNYTGDFLVFYCSGGVSGNIFEGWIDNFRFSDVARYAIASPFVGNTLEDIYLRFETGYSDSIDYLAVAGHNFGTLGCTCSIEITSDTSSPFTGWSEIIAETVITDDEPLIFQFVPQVVNTIRLRIQSSVGGREAAVMYVGSTLTMERGVRVDVPHVPFHLGHRIKTVNGLSENSNFIGRIPRSIMIESKAQFSHITNDFYRTSVDPFIAAARETPFFFAWAPDDYPNDTGYGWLTKDAVPEMNTVTRRFDLSLEMQGLG